MAGGPRSVSSHRGGHYRVRAMIPAETGAVVSSASESELLPACLRHLRVSVISVGRSRASSVRGHAGEGGAGGLWAGGSPQCDRVEVEYADPDRGRARPGHRLRAARRRAVGQGHAGPGAGDPRQRAQDQIQAAIEAAGPGRVEVDALFRPDAAPWIRARRALKVCEQGRAAGAGTGTRAPGKNGCQATFGGSGDDDWARPAARGAGRPCRG